MVIWLKTHEKHGEDDLIPQKQRTDISNAVHCYFYYIFIDFIINLLIFIKNMIYFSKLIDFCVNRQESPKVVDIYFVGTKKQYLEI